MIITTGVTTSFLEMTLIHDYASSQRTLKVVYIEYHDGIPHSVTTSSDGYMTHFDFTKDCWDDEGLMCFNSGGGGSIKEIQAPAYTDEAKGTSYWLHPDAGFRGNPKNIAKLDEPIQFNGDPNPFLHARETSDSFHYCKFCDKEYDDNNCPYHHVYSEENDRLEYHDGTSAED